MGGKGRIRIDWLSIILIMAAMIGSYFLAMRYINMAEPILITWVAVGAVAAVMTRIIGRRNRRRRYEEVLSRTKEEKKVSKAEEQRNAVKDERELLKRDNFTNSQLKEDPLKEDLRRMKEEEKVSKAEEQKNAVKDERELLKRDNFTNSQLKEGPPKEDLSRTKEEEKVSKAEEQKNAVKDERELLEKDNFTNSQLKEDQKKELNFFINRVGLNRVLLDETLVHNIVKKLLEVGEKGFGKETYCYCGVSDRQKKFILTRYSKGKFEGQEGIHDEKYIVLYGTDTSNYKAAALKSWTDAWGDAYAPCKVEADPENIYDQIKEYIMPAVIYINKADGHTEFKSEIKEIFQMSCAEYEWKNYIQVLKKYNKFILITETLQKQITECIENSRYGSYCTRKIEYGLYNRVEDIFMAHCGGLSGTEKQNPELEEEFFVFIAPRTSFITLCSRNAKEEIQICDEYRWTRDEIIEEMVLYYTKTPFRL